MVIKRVDKNLRKMNNFDETFGFLQLTREASFGLRLDFAMATMRSTKLGALKK